MRVQLKNCPQEPMLVGCEGEVVGYDHIPWCEPSNDPLVDVRLDGGHRETVFLSDCVPAGGWPVVIEK
jgi:hypothetical protein